jgi:hypothetical protein
VAGERRLRHPLRARVERRDHLVAALLLALELVEDRLQVGGVLAVEQRIAVALDAGAAEVGEGVADRVGELAACRIGAFVGAFGSAHAVRQHGAVGGDDRAAFDPLLLEQRARVEMVFAQRGGFEDRPARGERDEHREQQHDQAEQADDRGVHRSCLIRAFPLPCCGSG